MFPNLRANPVKLIILSVLGTTSCLVVLCFLIVPQSASAATVTTRPNADVTAGWQTQGTNDGTCPGSHCTRLDESTPNTNDLIETDVLLGTARTALFEMSNVDVGQGATQITVRTYARSGFALPFLDAMDQIIVSLWINGQYTVGSPVITPSYPNWQWFETTFTGNWSQSEVDAMRVRLVSSIQGLGLVQNNLQVATLEAVITYTPSPVLTQTPYRIYENSDSSAPGAPLGATDTPVVLPEQYAPFRIRLGVTVSAQAMPSSYQNLKLQYAQKDGACDPAFSGETYTDVSSSGPIQWYENVGVANGAAISSYTHDPVTSSAKVYQTYRESNPFTNPNLTGVNNTALWDFALQDSGANPGTSYCFRLVESDGTLLNTYAVIPEVTTVGKLTVSMVDPFGDTITQPVVTFEELSSSTSCQLTNATLGTNDQRLRITNDLVTNGWSASIAPTDGENALWYSIDSTYDLNDPTGAPAGCADGPDTDDVGGQLSIDPSSAVLNPKSGCTTEGITKGDKASFSEGVVQSMQLIQASSDSERFCWWDVTNIALEQRVPPGQPSGTYTTELTVTLVAY